MNAIIKVKLSDVGRKAQILAGLNADEVQSITVGPDDPAFPAIVAAGTIEGNAVVLNRAMWSAPAYDALPGAQQVLDDVAREEVAETAKQAEDLARRRAETLAVLQGRKTTTQENMLPGGIRYDRVQIAWPYNPLPEITESAEAKAWHAELTALNDAAKANADALLAAKLEADAEANRVSREKEVARRAALGLRDGDDDFEIENGALTQCPCWESHKRGKNWMATITPSPASPGGLARTFAEKAHGSSFYMLPALEAGEAVEFGADYYSGSGRPNKERWYGYVVRIDAEADGHPGRLILHKCADGKEAHKQGAKFAERLAADKPAVDATTAS